MTAGKPPSQRDAENVVRHHSRQLQSMVPGAAGGRLASAQPLPAGTYLDADVDGDDWAADGVLAWNDTFTVSSTGTQTLSLSWLPVENSEHFYWHPAAGAAVYWTGDEWTREGQTITVLDPGGIFEVGDKITIEYLYLDGADTDDLTEYIVLAPVGNVYGVVHNCEDNTPSVVGTGDVWFDEDPSTYVEVFRENAFFDYGYVRPQISEAPADFPTSYLEVASVIVHVVCEGQPGSPAIVGCEALIQTPNGTVTRGAGLVMGGLGSISIPITWGSFSTPNADLQAWIDDVNLDGRYQLTLSARSEAGSFPHFSKWMKIYEAWIEVVKAV